MTNSSDRLDRIEAILAETAASQARTQQIVESNSRAIEALTSDQVDHREAVRSGFTELGRLLVQVVDLLTSRLESLERWRRGEEP